LSNASIKEGAAIGTDVGEIRVESENSSAEYNFELKGPFNILIQDYLPASFYVENNRLKSLEVFTYNEMEKTRTVFIKAINQSDNLFYEKRFEISILKNTTAISTVNETGAIHVYASANTLHISSTVPCKYVLYSLSGVPLESATIDAGEHCIPAQNRKGCYIISVISENNIYTKKLIIHNL
jgi:hypothetical protein